MSEHIYEDSDMEHERYHIIPFGSMHEEIVRCRDCCWLSEDDSMWYCRNWGANIAWVEDAKPDGFCSWGKVVER